MKSVPLLFVFATVVVIFSTDRLVADEICSGDYDPSTGPGYLDKAAHCACPEGTRKEPGDGTGHNMREQGDYIFTCVGTPRAGWVKPGAPPPAAQAPSEPKDYELRTECLNLQAGADDKVCQQAIEAYSRTIAESVRKDYEDYEEYGDRGDLYRKTKNWPAALDDYKRGIELCDDDSEEGLCDGDKEESATFHAKRAKIFEELKDFSSAIAEMNEALVLNPKYAYYNFSRGRYHAERSDYASAIADFDRSIELGRENDELLTKAHFQRGLAYEKKGDKARATTDLEHVLLQTPDDNEVKDALKRVYRMP